LQPSDTAKKKTDTSSSTAAQRYLAQIYPYREIILQVSNDFMKNSLSELASNHPKLQNYERQIAVVIRNLENLGRPPSGVRFNKKAVLKHLFNARTELNTTIFLATAPDVQINVLSLEHLNKCHYYLNLAISLIPSPTSS